MSNAITKEMIFEAANALVAEGKQPKVAAVRHLLGKGSFTTINEAMKEWREGQKAPEAPVRESAPQGVTDRLQALGNEIWRIALELANESLRGERETLEAFRVEMEEQQRETAEMADELANEVELLRAQNEEVKRLLMDCSEQLAEEKAKAIKLAAQVETSNRHIEDLKEENRSTRSLLDQANKERDRMIEHERKQATEIARLEGTLQSRDEKHRHEVETLVDHKDRSDEAKRQAEGEARKAQEAAQAAKEEAAKLRGEVAALTKQVEQQAKLFESLTKPKASAKAETKKEGAAEEK